jgi:hypothetical protein
VVAVGCEVVVEVFEVEVVEVVVEVEVEVVVMVVVSSYAAYYINC